MAPMKFSFVYLEHLCIYYRHLCSDSILLYLPNSRPPPSLRNMAKAMYFSALKHLLYNQRNDTKDRYKIVVAEPNVMAE